MSFSSGTFSINTAGQPVVTGTVISSTAFNALTADLATGLSTCILKDGTQVLTGNIPFGTYKITGLGAGSALTDSANLQQVQYGFGSFLTGVGGTNTITATATPTPAYTVGQRFTFTPANTNTGAATLNISSVGAGAVQWKGAALIGGELVASLPVTVYVSAATPVFEIVSGGGSLAIAPTASVAAHATTSDVWTARETVLTGAAVTFTDIADAPYVGAVAWVYMNAAHVWTDGAVFDVQGGATYTTAIGDWVRINAVTVSTFDVTVFTASGQSVGYKIGTSQATTSGTSFSFPGLPAGTKRVTMNLVGVSLSGTDALQVQIGPVAGVETSGYLGSVGSGATFANFTAAFGLVTTGGAGSVHHGTLTLTLENASTNIWTASGTLGLSNAATAYLFAYSKPLAGVLSVIKLMTNGSDTFDAGEVNITYE